MSLSTEKNHVVLIDTAKGIGIILIVFGHSWIVAQSPGELFRIIYSVHIPLFLLLSGVFHNPNIPILTILKSKADSLLKPYFVTLLLFAICFLIITSNGNAFLITIFKIVYGSPEVQAWIPLWYLPHLFLITIFSTLILKLKFFNESTLVIRILLLALLIFIGTYTIRTFWLISFTWNLQKVRHIGLPFSADILLVTSSYFLTGYFLREHVKEFKKSYLLMFACLSIFVAIFLLTNLTTDLHRRRYGDPILSTLWAFSGIYLILCASSVIANYPIPAKVFSYLGKNSLFILLFHMLFQNIAFRVANELSERKFYNSIFAFIVALSLSMLLGEIIRRIEFLRILYLPFKKPRQPDTLGAYPL